MEVFQLDKKLEELLADIYAFGEAHDKVLAHAEQMLNITPDTGVFISILVRAAMARSVLEIGTSNGYSTLWIADALSDIQGKVTTVEISQTKASMARANFERSKLSEFVDLHLEDIREFLKPQSDDIYDLIFLDAERPEYSSYWIDVDRVLKTGGLLIVDNALSPKPEELTDLLRLIERSGRYMSQIVRLGKGELLALKQGKSKGRMQ